MRFVLALVSLVIAVVLIGLGIAQRTILAGPDSLTAASISESTAPVTILGGETLNAMPGLQTIQIGGGEPVFAAYARTSDVDAWVGDASHNELGFDPETRQLTTTVVSGAEDTVPSPAGSDLWLEEFSSETDLRMLVNLDPGLSVILVTDGTAPAPAEVSVTWPMDNRTPLALPLVLAGAGMLVLALIFFAWALLHQRLSRGPRRASIRAGRGTRMPKLPKQRSYRVRKPKAVTQGKGRRSARRMSAVVAMPIIGVLALSGCSPELLDDTGGPSASIDPSASASPVENPAAAAASVGQVRSIVTDAARVAEASDAALDGEALTERFAGPALEVRRGNYAIRSADSAYTATAAIPTEFIRVTLPQVAGSAWPRSLFTVVSETDDGTSASVALTLVQEEPRANYKVVYAVTLEPDAVLPELAPEGIGALPLGPESALLSVAPSTLLSSYIDVLDNGEESPAAELFDLTSDSLIPQLTQSRDDTLAELGDTGSAEFQYAAGEGDTIALASNETGALVNVYMTGSVTVTPAEDGATINPGEAVRSLTGVTSTTTGVTASYGDQLLFYIPPIGSNDKIVLLGFTDGLVSAEELP